MIFSKGMVYPIFQMGVNDPKTNSGNQTMLYYEYVRCFSKITHAALLFQHHHNIFRIIKRAKEIFRTYQTLAKE
jgi:hypothetical protein